MVKKFTLICTGDSKWCIKHTDFNDIPERIADWVKFLKRDNHVCERQHTEQHVDSDR